MQHLPTGTVTLLFTDIEGSTQLLEQLGPRYPDVLAECRSLLRTAFHGCGGHEVDTQGDAFFVAFARTSDAVSAAVAAQRALASHTFAEGVAVPVRMGLHTGEPSVGAEGYVGLDVQHTTRIMSVGHGGQVLLSQTTRELVKHDLPEGVGLRDLGEQRLKDLQYPSHLFQLVIAGLPAHFPPLKTLDSHPHNLPVQPTPLIGRDQPVAAILRLLIREEVRLVTLTGPGGTGKTRLGLQVAAELSETFTDGVYFVNLAPLGDPHLVVPTIAQTLDLKEVAGQPLLDLLKGALHWKHLLLLLDNFEQVVDAAMDVAALLAVCPNLKVLVTSRMPLHVRGEQEFAVPPLAVPDPKRLPDLVTLSQYEAVALFVARSQAVRPDFQVTNASAPAIAEICVRLDGLPLAIELAAARSKVLPPQALLARLGQRLTVLTSGARDAPVRQQTLRNTITWSYDLLEAQEQHLFRLLCVFVGGGELSAIETICTALSGAAEAGSLLDGLGSLIDKSLLQQREMEVEKEQEPRFLLLETIREYGLEVLAASGELQAARQAHALYYLALVEQAAPHLKGSEQVGLLARLEQELDNLRAALSWFLEAARQGPGSEEGRQQAERALRLCIALFWFWDARRQLREAWTFLKQALAVGEGVAASVRARALYAAANLTWIVEEDNDGAEALARESLTFYRELGDRDGIATSLRMLSGIASTRSQYAVARSQLDEAEALFKEAGEVWGRGKCLTSLGQIATVQGEYARARALLEESRRIFSNLGDQHELGWVLILQARMLFLSGGHPFEAQVLAEQGLELVREIGDTWMTMHALNILGQIRLQQGEQALARELFEACLATGQALADSLDIAEMQIDLAHILVVLGELDRARALYQASLVLLRENDNEEFIPACLKGLADIAAAQGEPVWAARLWGVAEALREALGTPLPPVARADYERAVAAARTTSGGRAFAAAWAEGRTMTPEQVLTVPPPMGEPISSEPSSTSPVKSPLTYPDDLTAREVEVLCLLAQGWTDAQIAEQLVISPRTVNTHLTSIYRKIQVSTRSAATRYTIDHHLV